jgi:hypothetical protein
VLPSDLGEKEGCNEVVITAWQLCFDESFGGEKIEVDAFSNVFLVLAAVDDLLIVDGYDGRGMSFGVKVSKGVEVADDELRCEVHDSFEVRRGVANDNGWRAHHVIEHGPVTVHGSIVVSNGKSLYFYDIVEVFFQEVVSAPGHDDANAMIVFQKVGDDHFGSRGMPHAFANDTV